MRKPFLLLLISWLGCIGIASAADTVSDNNLWINANTSGKLTEKVLAYAEIQPRLVDDSSQLGAAMYRVALGYAMTDKWSLWAGYGLIHFNYPDHFLENRTYLQSTYNFNYDKWSVSNRSRFEFRRLEDRAETALRLRHQIRSLYEIHEANKIFFVLWDELFYHLNTVPGTNHKGFDQNRIFGGVGHKFGEKLNHFFEVGYLNQYIVRFEKANVTNDILALQYIYNF